MDSVPFQKLPRAVKGTVVQLQTGMNLQCVLALKMKAWVKHNLEAIAEADQSTVKSLVQIGTE